MKKRKGLISPHPKWYAFLLIANVLYETNTMMGTEKNLVVEHF